MFRMIPSWTVQFFAEHARVMDVPSVLRYRNFAIRSDRGQALNVLLPIRMRAPVNRTIYLREIGSDPLTFHEVFIERVYECVLSVVPRCHSMIDLGGNIGLASLYLSTHYECPVFAVEPNPGSYDVLVRNLVKTDRERTFQAAVWSKPTALAGAAGVDTPHYSMFSTVESADGPIKGLPMPELIEKSGFSSVDLLKVDIEGAERALFAGDLDWLEVVNAIAIEFHDSSRQDIHFDELMQRYGFRIALENRHTVVAVKI